MRDVKRPPVGAIEVIVVSIVTVAREPRAAMHVSKPSQAIEGPETYKTQ